MRNVCLFALLVLSTRIFAGWSNLNTGIADNLTGVAFWGNNGALSGYGGVYYTTTGGVGPSSWTRFNITGNTADSILYNSTKFLHAYPDAANANQFFVCGKNLLTNKAVIMKISLSALTYTVVYNASAGSGLNNITYCNQYGTYYAVGENGLIVNFNSTPGSATIINSGFNNNLFSISFSNAQFFIGTNGALIGGTNNSNVFTYNIYTTPAYTYSSVICTGLNFGYSVGNSYYKSNGASPLNQPNYDFGPLNGRYLFNQNNMHFVGTDHGIFRSTGTYAFLEWQPSSMNYTINCLSSSTATMYACGANGVVLSSTDLGGTPKPVAKLSLGGGCKGSSIPINGLVGTSSSCAYYINGAFASSNCGGFSQTFTASAQYTVQLFVNSTGGSDTALQVINIVDTPKVNLPVVASKTVLCHQEPIAISIYSSQVNVFYTLQKFGSSSSFGSSGSGNGGAITYTTVPLSQAGNYYLKAQSTLANCYRNFTDTLKINVEKTKASFYVNKVNVTPGEQIKCYQHCTDAQNYAWTFLPGANPGTSSLPNPTLSFSNTGSTQIKLVCWSNNGCYDSTTATGPKAYIEPTTADSCWTMVNNNNDPQTGYFLNVDQVSLSKSGFYACGTYNDERFASRYGDSLHGSFFTGGYAIKYSVNGAVKWKVFTRHDQSGLDYMRVVKEDKMGNIYVCGFSNGAFYDNAGDSTVIPYTGTTSGFVAKLDSLGKLIWFMNTKSYTPVDLSFDKNDFLLVTGGGLGAVTFSLNGIPTYTLTNPNSTNFALLKVNPQGTVLWDAKMTLASVNGADIDKVDVDKDNNIYMLGFMETYAKIYSAGTSTFVTVNGIAGNYGAKLFLAKYDSSGIVKWALRSRTIGAANDNTSGYSMATDSLGNCYISGQNSWGPGYTHVFENTNSTTTSLFAGQYFVAKVNSAGICKWLVGAKLAAPAAGYMLNKSGNEISVLGQIGSVSGATVTDIFTSTNNTTTLSLSSGSSDYFIAVYDTAGVLKRITKNGNNGYVLSISNWARGLCRRNDGAYYFGRSIRFFQGMSNFNNFGTNIASTNGIDGTITRVGGNCGITYPLSQGTVTSVQERNNEGLKIYPNPANDEFTVENNGNKNSDIELEITDQLGRLIYSQRCSCSVMQVNVRDFVSGVYLVRIHNDSSTITSKLVIE